MRDVYAQYGDDYDVAALTAEALMVRTPWLSDSKTAAAEGGHEEAIAIIEKLGQVRAKNDTPHPVPTSTHIMEMSPEPSVLGRQVMSEMLLLDAGTRPRPRISRVVRAVRERSALTSKRSPPTINTWSSTQSLESSRFTVCTTFISTRGFVLAPRRRYGRPI